MKKRKIRAIRVIVSLTILSFLWSCSSPILAATPQVEISGTVLNFDVSPVIVNGRILVPIRTVFEAMGAKVSWEQATTTATAVKGSTTVILPVGSRAPTINGVVKPIDVPGTIIDGRTMAPLRFVCEAFGGKVEWSADTQTAVVKISPSPAADAPAKKGLTVGEDKGF